MVVDVVGVTVDKIKIGHDGGEDGQGPRAIDGCPNVNVAMGDVRTSSLVDGV